MKELKSLDNNSYLKIRDRILSLASTPRPVGSIKLTNQEGYRVRIGDFRILYEIDENAKTVKLLKIGLRKDVYKSK